MKRWRRIDPRSFLLGLLLAVVVLGFTGCASTDEDHLSERPWNSPKQWENGLPTQMFEGR